MKTNSAARGVRRIRIVVLCLAVGGMVAGEFRLGESLASRFGQVTACRSQSSPAPSVGLSDLMAAAR